MKDIKGLREKRKRKRRDNSDRKSEQDKVFEKVDRSDLKQFEAGETFFVCTDCGELNSFPDYCKECISSINPRFAFEKQEEPSF